jgi:EmrB/QacA subfamily drug resistance transporter
VKLLVTCAAQFLVVLDVSIVNVALPAMRDDLGFGPSGLEWVVNAYALAFAGFLLLGGRVADLFGRRRALIAGLVLFAGASLAGGLATAPWALVAARSVQGLGGALLMPATLAILTATYPEGPQRARAVAVWSAVGAAGGAAGSVFGGLLTDFLSWRWTLLINVPIGAAAIVVALLVLDPGRDGGGRRLDVLGAVTVTAGLTLPAFGVTQTREHGWGAAATLLPLVAGILLLLGFLAVQAWVAREPLMPLRIFRSRSVSSANVVILLTGGAGFAMWYFVSLYLQNVRGYGALEAGLAFLPHTAAIIAAARVAPRLMARIGIRATVVLGALVAAAGFFWQSRLTVDSGLVTGVLLPGMVMTAGIGLTFTPLAAAATTGAARGDSGLVSGLLNSSRQIGGSVGLAALATIAAAHTQDLGASGAAVTAGYSRAFLIASILLLVAAAATVLLPPPPRTPKAPALAEAARAGAA